MINEITHIERPTESTPLLGRLFNAIKDAVTEMDRCPGDSIQDIWNEMLDKWETGLRMDHNHNIDPNNVLSGSGERENRHG